MADPAAEKLAADLAGQLAGLENLSRALGQTNYAELAVQADKLRRANDELLQGEMARARLLEREQALLSGNALSQLRERVRLERELSEVGRREATLARGQRREAVRSGQYLSDAQAAAREQLRNSLQDARERRVQLRVAREQAASPAAVALARARAQDRRDEGRLREQQARLDRRADLEARYGLRGGAVAYNLERFGRHPLTRAGFGMAAVGATTVFGAATSGFSNTVEMNRFQLEMRLISREIAGAFKPALEGVTDRLRSFRQVLEHMTPRQQNYLMYGGLALGGAVALQSASRSLSGMGLGELAIAGASFARGRGGAALLRRAGPAAVITGAVAAGTTGFGYDFDRPFDEQFPSLKGKSAQELEVVAERQRRQQRWAEQSMGEINRFGQRMFYSVYGMGRDIGLFSGTSKFDKGLAPSEVIAEEAKRRLALQKGANGRSVVTPADAGFEEIASGYDRLSIQLANLTGRKDEDKERERKVAENIQKIADNTTPKNAPEVNR